MMQARLPVGRRRLGQIVCGCLLALAAMSAVAGCATSAQRNCALTSPILTPTTTAEAPRDTGSATASANIGTEQGAGL